MEAIFPIILIGLVLIGIVLALGVLCCGAVGAMHQFAWASEFGFIGVIVFFAAWVCMCPIMAVWAVIWGLLALMN